MPKQPPAKVSYSPPAASATPIAEIPKIDGRLNEECWKKIAPLSDFVNLATGKPGGPRTHVRVATSRRWLYIGAVCETPDVTRVQTLRTERDSDVFNDESFEALLDPVENHGRIFRFIINARGTRLDEIIPTGGRGIAAARPVWFGRARRDPASQWTAEIAVDLASLELGAKNTGAWRVNFLRHSRGPVRNDSAWAWARFWVFGCDRERMGVVSGIETRGVTPGCTVRIAQCSLLPEDSTVCGSLVAEVVNPADARQTVDVTLRTPTRWIATRRIKVGRQGRESVTFPVEMDLAEEHELKVELSDPETRLPIAAVAHPFSLPQPVTAWFDRTYYTHETTAVLQSRLFACECEKAAPSYQLFNAETSALARRGEPVAPTLLSDRSLWFAATVPLSSLGFGGYLAETVWESPDAHCRYRIWSALRRLPPRQGEVKVNTVIGCLMRDGRAFYPIELRRLDQPTPAIFNDIKLNGAFNVNWAWQLSPRGNDAYIAGAAKAVGALADLNIDRIYLTSGTVRDQHVDSLKRIAAMAPVFAYGMENPPAEDGFSTEPMTTLRNYLHSLDPYHPLYVVLGHPSQAARYRDCADYLVMRCRAVGAGGACEPEWVYEQMRRAKEGAGRTVPVVAMLSAYRDAEQGLERPTPLQIRAATYMALIAGAAGVIFDGYHFRVRTDPERRGYSDDPALLKTIYMLTHYVARLGPIVLLPEATDAVSIAQPPFGTVRWTARQARGGLYVLAVNGGARPAVAAFQFAHKTETMEVRELFEGHTLPLDEGRFSVQFAPYETHVFVAAKK